MQLSYEKQITTRNKEVPSEVIKEKLRQVFFASPQGLEDLKNL